MVKQVQKTVETEEAERVLLVKVSKQNSKKSSRGGRKFGAIKQNCWKEHKMVSQNRTIYGEVNGESEGWEKSSTEVLFFRQSGKGMRPQLLALGSGKNDGRCSKDCRSSKKNIS